MLMAKPKSKKIETEKDSAYFLKLVLYIVLGTLWIKLGNPIGIFNGVPIGLFLGILFASHDHFVIDRKIEYAILIIMTIMSALFPPIVIFL
jgi:hypothetical protein